MFPSRNHEKVCPVFQQLDPKDAASIAIAQSAMENPFVRQELACISSNFGALPNAIKQLEGRSLSLLDSMGVIDKVCKKLETAEGKLGSAAQSKMTAVLKKNPGFKSLQAINVAITGTEGSGPLEVDVGLVRFYRYAPITSVEVERSFSTLKAVLGERRRSMTPSNIEKLIVAHFNSQTD